MRPALLTMSGSVLVVLGCTSDYNGFIVAPSPNAGTGGQGGDVGATSSTATSGGGASAAAGGGGLGGTGGNSAGGAGTAGTGGSASCGNGVVEPGEQCDDQNDSSTDGCDACACSSFDPASQHCYLLVSGGAWTWDEAPTACPRGWNVASIETVAERDFVDPLSPITVAAWIGGTDQGPDEGTFEWLSGEPWTFAPMQDPWSPNEPNNYNDEDCVELVFTQTTAKFNDRECDKEDFAVLCELTP